MEKKARSHTIVNTPDTIIETLYCRNFNGYRICTFIFLFIPKITLLLLLLNSIFVVLCRLMLQRPLKQHRHICIYFNSMLVVQKMISILQIFGFCSDYISYVILGKCTIFFEKCGSPISLGLEASSLRPGCQNCRFFESLGAANQTMMLMLMLMMLMIISVIRSS